MSDPTIGLPLPRVTHAYAEPAKWDQWILADRGHGEEWRRVFHVERADAERVWCALAEAVLDAPLSSVRKLDIGVSCEVHILLTIDARTSQVRTVWHYSYPGAVPRLVTAFPTP
jgi:hypothetical protein